MLNSKAFFIVTCLISLVALPVLAIHQRDRLNASKTGFLDPNQDAHVQAWIDAPDTEKRNRQYYVDLGLLPPLGGMPAAAPPVGIVLDDTILRNEAALAPILRHIAEVLEIPTQGREFFFLRSYLHKYRTQPQNIEDLKRFMKASMSPFVTRCLELPPYANNLRFTAPDARSAVHDLTRKVHDLVASYKYDPHLNTLNIAVYVGAYKAVVECCEGILHKDALLKHAASHLIRDNDPLLEDIQRLKDQMSSLPLSKDLSPQQKTEMTHAEAKFMIARLKLSFIYCMNQLAALERPLEATKENLSSWTFERIFRIIYNTLAGGEPDVEAPPGAPILKQKTLLFSKILVSILLHGRDTNTHPVLDLLRSPQSPLEYRQALCYLLLTTSLTEDDHAWVKKTLAQTGKPLPDALSRRENILKSVQSKLETFIREIKLANSGGSQGKRDPKDDEVPSFKDRKRFFEGKGGVR